MTAVNENGQLYWTFEEVSQHPAVEEMVSKYIQIGRASCRERV